jgi:DNA mismatch repair protein MutH
MKTKHFTLIHPDGRTETLDGPEDLEKLQGWVGGYIEKVPGFTRFEGRNCYAFANEEGKLKQLPLNSKATAVRLPRYGSLNANR